MISIREVPGAVKNDFRTDVNWNRAAHLGAKAAHALPSASAQYVLEKFPIIGWLPKYNPRWIINDIIAGLTIGLMLIPQGLSYAKIATIPVQYGLMSSWLPATIYAFMGTTKDLSTGPTSLIGLLTSDVVEEFQDEYTPSQIASAVAMMMGVYGMVLGFLKLGFLLEFISLPILSGFISAVAITIMLNQMGSLLGETNIGDGTARQIHDIFQQLPNANGWACLIGFTGILFMTILEKSGKYWGKQYKVIWFLSITRAFLTLVLFTGVGYAVNHNRASGKYLFDVVQVKSNGQEAPSIPPADLIAKVASRSIAVFIGAAVEHTAIARAFGVHNNYVTDQSQELCYFGVTNFFNSWFHAMGVGGAMSRTAVNSASKVRSPLSGLVTMAVVLVSIYKLVGTLFWIPKATLAAIIICACWPLVSPPSVFYRFWKSSLADFVSSMIAFWVSLFVSTEAGIGASVGFNIVYVLLRQVFTRIQSSAGSELTRSIEEAREGALPPNFSVPNDVRVFKFHESFFFPNSYSTSTRILDTVKTHHAPHYRGSHSPESERNWSVVGEQRVARLRKKEGVTDPSSLPPLSLVVLDFGRVNHTDATAVRHLLQHKKEIEKYAGEQVELRFACMSPYIRERFERCGWPIMVVDGDESSQEVLTVPNDGTMTMTYRDVASAVLAPRMLARRGTILEDEMIDKEEVYDEKSKANGSNV
ncbi:hypothetical protein GQ53DRAFT_878022 [Thozetella sp. PMI_491]|nr:hypothetical protein GQ53DRAFT_878022 [Thozetella sp. PMI_491]